MDAHDFNAHFMMETDYSVSRDSNFLQVTFRTFQGQQNELYGLAYPANSGEKQ